jgi:hypothetical protein
MPDINFTTPKKNYVFISYNHKDVVWAKRLQKRLEWYRLPDEINNEFTDSRYIRPVFRDRDTLTSGVLNEELRNHLEASQYLLVVCSPNAAQSDWVSEEIKAFIEMGRVDKIIPFIIEGSPKDYSQSDIRQPLMGECFPLALRQWNAEHPDKRLLGISVTDDGKTNHQKAFIRLVAFLLGLEFDTLWHRHRRYMRRLITLLSVLAVVVLVLIYWFVIPVRVSVTLNDQSSALPDMEQGILTFNDSEYPFSRPDTTIDLGSLPGYFRLRKMPIRFHAARFYEPEEQLLPITIGVNQHFTMQLHRDSTFAVFEGHVYDGDFDDFESKPLAGAVVKIGEYEVTTDAEGDFRIVFPLDEQSETKPIDIQLDGYQPYYREDESPNSELKYLLHRVE